MNMHSWKVGVFSDQQILVSLQNLHLLQVGSLHFGVIYLLVNSTFLCYILCPEIFQLEGCACFSHFLVEVFLCISWLRYLIAFFQAAWIGLLITYMVFWTNWYMGWMILRLLFIYLYFDSFEQGRTNLFKFGLRHPLCGIEVYMQLFGLKRVYS